MRFCGLIVFKNIEKQILHAYKWEISLEADIGERFLWSNVDREILVLQLRARTFKKTRIIV